jgi:hypothetical protein
MRGISEAVVIVVIGSLSGQPIPGLLLHDARHISGTVFDVGGNPVEGASIDHTGDFRHAYQTDAQGKFELDTRAPALVIRKAGLQSEFIRTQNAAEIRVTLQKLSQLQFPPCSSAGPPGGSEGRDSSFEFRETAKVKQGRQGQDIDYSTRNYYAQTELGRKWIVHGSGAMWSFGTPVEQDVWRSAIYKEVVYDGAGQRIIDARGIFSNGQRWRTLAKFGETASYSDVDQATATLFDDFLDRACLKFVARR